MFRGIFTGNPIKQYGYDAAGTLFSVRTRAASLFSPLQAIPVVKLAGIEKTPEEMRNMLLNEPKLYRLTGSAPAESAEHAKNGEQKDKEQKASSSIITRVVIGCAGQGPKSPQEAVAALMDQLIAAMKEKPGCIIILGDNIYPSGVTDPKAKEFATHFYQMYRNEKFAALKKIRIFLILGNHCVNISLYGERAGNVDKARAYAQVAHTYLECKTPEMYLADKLDLSQLPAWNMPRACYGLLTEGDPKQEEGALLELFVHWNTIVRDYLNSLDKEKENPHNQANFLRREFAAAKEKHKDRLVTYVYSHGPRTLHDKGLIDSPKIKYGLYLTEAEQTKLAELKFTGANYNEVFGEVLDRLGVACDVVYAADTHALYNYLAPKDQAGRRIYQVGAGGGGNSDLEDKRDMQHIHQLRYMKTHGCVVSRVDLRDKERRVTNDFHTTTGLHLKFSQENEFPVVMCDDERVRKLRDIVATAYRKYFATLGSTSMHGSDGVKHADDLYHLFHQAEPLRFEQAVKFLIDFFDLKSDGLSITRDASLISYINEEMQNVLGISLLEFYRKTFPEKKKEEVPAPKPADAKAVPVAADYYAPLKFLARTVGLMPSPPANAQATATPTTPAPGKSAS